MRDHQIEEKPNIKGDKLNILLLTFLYILQGVPGGVVHAIPFIMQNRGVTYEDQAGFSFVMFAYSFKLLWAPIVDCIYSNKFGRRKTWFIPAQYFMGVCLLLISMNMDDWMGDDSGIKKPKVRTLTIVFFLCIFFAATQDIAVDGWSLTMLKRRNVGYSSSCNAIGYYVGYFIGYVPFTILGSKEFCNKFRYIPQDRGMVSFAEFTFSWAIIYFITTTLVLIFKRDNSLDYVDGGMELKMNLKNCYRYVWKILKIKPVVLLIPLLLTSRIITGPVTAVALLKLTDIGISRNDFALISIPLLPFKIILPIVLRRYLTVQNCFKTFLSLTIYRGIIGIFLTILVYFTSYLRVNKLPFWYYCILLILYGLEELTGFLSQVPQVAFFCRVSDPRFGGMYLTLLNTVSNIGGRWPMTLSLLLVDPLTIKSCSNESCQTILDGFYIEVFVATLIGFIWFYWSKTIVNQVENFHPSAWIVEHRSSVIKEDKSLQNRDVSVC